MGLAEEWKSWRERPFPSQVPASSDLGFELRSLDTVAAGCLDTYFSRGRLDDERIQALERCVRDLDSLLPQVPAHSSEYFAALADLCRRVLGAVSA